MQINMEGNYEILPNYTALDENLQVLVNKAIEAVKDSYSPYSQFAIGCAVKLDNGEIISGSNQENISFPAGICAERVTLHAALQQFPHGKIEALGIIARSQGKWVEEPITPCGICRQTMLEIVRRQKQSFPIYLASKNKGTIFIPKAEYLMPLSFTHEDLTK